MSDVFSESVRERVRSARRGLADAARSRDPSALSGALDELEDALHLARANGVGIPAGGEDAVVETGSGEGERA